MNELFEAALAARKNAHSPYSSYAVGAVVRTESGRLFSGCNVENAVYPLGQCAERVAIQSMVAFGEKSFTQLLLITEDGGTPCGACRQVMSEFSEPDAQVLIANLDGVIRETTVGALLPDAFSLESR